MKNILFVDDDRNITDGLARILRNKKEEWDMFFVNSGQEALDYLEENACDVIVTDYKMPGMDGLELLRQVREKYDKITRIILSGQLMPEIYEEAVKVSHEYISKPCDPGALISAIDGKNKSMRQCEIQKKS